MSGSGARPVRIAHAHGNRRHQIEAAAAADIDFIEADLWYRAGEIWVRHERRLGFLPLLVDRRPRGVNSIGPWAITIFARYYLRLDIDPLRLTELLEMTRGRCRLLLDLKGDLSEGEGRAFARTLVRVLAEAQCEESVILCGNMSVLDHVREAGPHLDVRHTIEEQWQWDGFLRRLDADPGLRGISMCRNFLSDPVAKIIRENGLQVFCWTVDEPKEARRLVELGVDGIISNSLPLLEALDGA